MKKKERTKAYLTIYVTPHEKKLIDELCAVRGLARGALFVRLVREELDRLALEAAKNPYYGRI